MSAYALETERFQFYAHKRNLSVAKKLGHGQDGIVFLTHRPSAVKALTRRVLYEKERDVYRRIEECDIREVAGFALPRLIGTDDDLMIVEMTFVTPPFVVDFATAYLDIPPAYFKDEHMMAEWRASRIKLFGQEDWPRVVSAMAELRGYGIYLADVKPGNVTIAND